MDIPYYLLNISTYDIPQETHNKAKTELINFTSS